MLALLLIACSPETPEGCAAQEGAARDDCFLQELNCKEIQDEDVKDSCLAEVAKSAADLKGCEVIDSTAVQNYCQEQIAVLTNNPEICKGISDLYWQDNCYVALGVKLNQSQLCSMVSNQGDREKCNFDVALKTNDEKICPKAGVNDTERCYYTIAKKTLRLDICPLLSEPVNQDACRFSIAKSSNDSSVCSSIKFNQIRADCNDYFQNQTNK
jgi:hypothetical protein